VLDWRLPEPAAADPGPLPWLPGIGEALHDHPVWGQYLAKRSQLVTGLANRIRSQAGEDDTQPVWVPPGSRPNLAIIGEVAVWRAANGITPAIHDQPEQHSRRQLRPSGSATSTEVSPAAATATSVILTSQSTRLVQPRVIAGTKIDSACPNHPPSTRTRRPAPADRSPRPGACVESPNTTDQGLASPSW
jgi:hypothetical protein